MSTLISIERSCRESIAAYGQLEYYNDAVSGVNLFSLKADRSHIGLAF